MRLVEINDWFSVNPEHVTCVKQELLPKDETSDGKWILVESVFVKTLNGGNYSKYDYQTTLRMLSGNDE